MPDQPEAFFLPASATQTTKDDQRFCIFHAAEGTSSSGATRGLVLYIHPFAEEMNKARRMAALQARALAQTGYAVLQIDLHGCGDSSGDFGDATWQGWVGDVVQGCHWLRRHGQPPGADSGQMPPLWLWGLRAGCLLAVEAAKQLGEPCNFLFWQPPASGKPLLQQFLRLKVVGDMLGGEGKGIMAGLREQLGAGEPIEVAGYRLSPSVAVGLEQTTLRPPPSNTSQRLEWLELSTREDAGLSPVSTRTIAEWQNAGHAARSHIVTGPAFWQTTEIEDAPALIAATTAALRALPA